MSSDRPLVLPKLGLTMTEGTVVEWSVPPGTRFRTGQTLFIVESDKTAVEVEAPSDGVLDEILVEPGTTVPVGTEIGKWTLEGEAVAAGDPPSPPRALPQEQPQQPRQSAQQSPQPHRIVATPLARKRASAHGLDLAAVRGTGPRGRVVAADIDAMVQDRGSLHPTTAHQRAMAARVSASKREIPHFYLAIDVDMGELLALRESANGQPGQRRISVTHLLVAAVVHALRRAPTMNRVWTEHGLRHLAGQDVGLAVDTPQGLVSPVVHDIGALPFAGIASKVDEVIGRARSGSLRAADLEGGAITLSNVGMHDVRSMTSIIVPGQSAILGVGGVQACFRPDAAGQPVLQREISIVLSADHRVHTGLSALGFLGELKSALQRPAVLLADGAAAVAA